jgi:hypothetical protein
MTIVTRDGSSKFYAFNNIRKTARHNNNQLALKAYTYERQFILKASKLFRVLERRVISNESKG